jgi:hypothetical protein
MGWRDQLLNEQQPDDANRRFRTRISLWWVGGYLSPILAAAFTIGWALVIYALIGDRSRTWQYVPGPYVPGEFVSTTHLPRPGTPPQQVELPKPMHGGMHGKQ